MQKTSTVLGHELFGHGARRVIIMNDWLCDTSTWWSARAYLDPARATWSFADLRGYGRSRERPGAFTLIEAADDIIALADALGWRRFAIVGHSMSTYVALHLAQHADSRIERCVLLTPGPLRGFGVDDAWLEQAQSSTRDPVRRAEAVRERFRQRLSPGWGEYKCQRWLASSDPEAAAAYIAMYARDGLPTPDAPVCVPTLVIAGAEDAPALSAAAARENLTPLCRELTITELTHCGHYPMEELPPLTAALVENFCAT